MLLNKIWSTGILSVTGKEITRILHHLLVFDTGALLFAYNLLSKRLPKWVKLDSFTSNILSY